MISAISHLAVSPAPASCSRARACWRWPIRRRCRCRRDALKLGAADRAADRGSAEGRLADALTRLGPTYVKLGQFLATRPDVVGVALARDLEWLQDQMAPFPQAEAEAAVAAALGKPLQEAFAVVRPGGCRGLDRAGASRRGGDARRPQPVAVKVLRPGVERRFRVDLEAFTLRRATPKAFPPKRGGCA